MLRHIIILFVAIAPLIAKAAGGPSTYFQLYVPPLNDSSAFPTSLVLTAVVDSTFFNVIDNAADGDSDDSHSGMLMAGQSYVIFLKDGAFNDDAPGMGSGIEQNDGDYFTIESTALIYAAAGNWSENQHSWLPSINKTNIGHRFYLHVGEQAMLAQDINVFPYQDDTTQIEIYQISPSAGTVSGYTQIDFNTAEQVAQATLNRGQDLIHSFPSGQSILQPGHTYMIQTDGPCSVMYGSLIGANQADGASHLQMHLHTCIYFLFMVRM
jgi:hypothetical protein